MLFQSHRSFPFISQSSFFGCVFPTLLISSVWIFFLLGLCNSDLSSLTSYVYDWFLFSSLHTENSQDVALSLLSSVSSFEELIHSEDFKSMPCESSLFLFVHILSLTNGKDPWTTGCTVWFSLTLHTSDNIISTAATVNNNAHWPLHMPSVVRSTFLYSSKLTFTKILWDMYCYSYFRSKYVSSRILSILPQSIWS